MFILAVVFNIHLYFCYLNDNFLGFSSAAGCIQAEKQSLFPLICPFMNKTFMHLTVSNMRLIMAFGNCKTKWQKHCSRFIQESNNKQSCVMLIWISSPGVGMVITIMPFSSRITKLLWQTKAFHKTKNMSVLSVPSLSRSYKDKKARGHFYITGIQDIFSFVTELSSVNSVWHIYKLHSDLLWTQTTIARGHLYCKCHHRYWMLTYQRCQRHTASPWEKPQIW